MDPHFRVKGCGGPQSMNPEMNLDAGRTVWYNIYIDGSLENA